MHVYLVVRVTGITETLYFCMYIFFMMGKLLRCQFHFAGFFNSKMTTNTLDTQSYNKQETNRIIL